MPTERILLTGADGQIGSELTARLRERFGQEAVLATDLRAAPEHLPEGPFASLDVTDAQAMRALWREHQPTQVYHLASLLSATGERKPQLAWDVNVGGLLNVLECCREYGTRLFWPSSIAVFGPGTPRDQTPQQTVIDPLTVYGIGKLAGERWCAYYQAKHGLDIRGLRYPGLISYTAPPGGGTTDYAVAIFFAALREGRYTCYLKPDTRMPMMYMDDAIRGTLELMDAPREGLQTAEAYNFAAIDFTPAELAAKLQERLPDFRIDYEPDERQAIADTWPCSIEDSAARTEWGWAHRYDLERLVDTMLAGVKAGLAEAEA
jgi:nucleoside-diphosphate-sugar epimerase